MEKANISLDEVLKCFCDDADSDAEKLLTSSVLFQDSFFLNHEMLVVGSTYWNMVYGQMPGDVLKDEEGLANMDNLAENLIWLMKEMRIQ